MSTVQEARLLADGIRAAKQGHAEQAREMLRAVIKLNARSELAWLWLSSVLETAEQRHLCLERVLEINPNHQAARRGIAALDAQAAVAPPPAPQPNSEPQPPLLITCPFCQQLTDGNQQDCSMCAENIILSCPTCDQPIQLWETTRCPCGEGLRHYIYVPEGIDHEGLGQRYAMAERWEAAARQWDRALTNGSHVTMLHRKLAQAYARMGNTEAAELHHQIATS